MKKWVSCILILMILLVTACTNESMIETASDAKPVVIQSVELKEHAHYLIYNGIVESSQLKQLSFKYGGTVNSINIEQGDYVTQGQSLLTLDQEELILKLNDDLKNKQIVLNTIEKTKAHYNYLMDQLEKNKALYDNGAISKQQLDDLQLEVNLAKNDLSIAQNNLERTTISLENTRNMINDYELIAPSEGIVADILTEEGENVVAGQPVVRLKNERLEINFGINQEDYQTIKKGDKILIEFEGDSCEGQVTSINQFPDQQTMTYQVTADLNNKELPINAIVKVKIPKQPFFGAKIPIDAIISRTDDYVYVINAGVATLKKINIELISGYDVICTGLDEGDQVVIEGMKNLNNGDQVTIKR